jgi:hypothetical protein
VIDVQHRKHIAFLIAYGPEVRAFLHSGLALSLADTFKVSVIARFPKSAAYHGLKNIAVLPMPEAKEGWVVRRSRAWAREAKAHLLESRGRKKWRHYLPPAVAGRNPRCSGLKSLFASAGGTASLTAAERLCGRSLGGSRGADHLLKEAGIDCLVASGFSSPIVTPFLQSARNAGIKSVVLTNSWKDVYVSPHVPVAPTRLAVCNANARDCLLEANPDLEPGTVSVAPSLHLQRFLKPDGILSRLEFCNRAGLDPAFPILCYTAASPSAVQNEEAIVALVAGALSEGRLPRHTQLLLRQNPMEDGSRFSALIKECKQVVAQKPKWEWDAVADWNCPLAEDLTMWTSTVFHSTLNISVPSTVTLEFLAMHRPVVNVCFDMPEPLSRERSTCRFWQAPFYEEFRNLAEVKPAFSCGELLDQVERQMTEGSSSACTNGAHTPPAQTAAEIIQDALGQ